MRINAAPRAVILDELRGFAALYVACAHVLLHNLALEKGWARLPWLFGQEMVMMFFLISGAAIRLSVNGRGGVVTWSFLQRRFLRLFPMIVLGLAAGYVAASVESVAWQPVRVKELLGNLLFLQDFSPVKPGTICSTYYGNAMLWSLSYEWWFYVIFTLVWTKVAASRRTHAVGVISMAGALSLLFWPNALGYWAAYFIVWWAGGTLVDPDQRERRRAFIWMCATAGGIGLVALKAHVFDHAPWRLGVFPLLLVRHVGVITALFGLLLIFGRRWRQVAGNFFRGFTWAAPLSYALYAIHYPLAADARWLIHTGLPAGAASALVYGGCALGAAWWAEKYYQPWASLQLMRVPGLRPAQ